MTLIEIDGGYVKPYPINFVEIGPGQRMSVLIKTGNHPAGTLFPVATNFRYRPDPLGGYTANGYGYLRYVDSKFDVKNAKPIMVKPLISSFLANMFPPVGLEASGWVLKNVKPLVPRVKDRLILGAIPDRTIKITISEVLEADHTTRFRNNGRPHIAWGTQNASLLDQIVSGFLGPVTPDPLDGFSVSHQTYPINYGEVVDLVFQNVKLPIGICVAHPWHTHGHSHYLIAEGPRDYVYALDKDVRTFATPLLKDVSMAYPIIVNGTNNCGWTKVRILANSPGIWAVHCHITGQGKMVVLEVAPEMIVRPIPPAPKKCLGRNTCNRG